MHKEDEFKQAQAEYKEIMHKMHRLKEAHIAQHKQLMADIQAHKPQPLDFIQPTKQSKEDLDKAEQQARLAKHEMWKILQSDFPQTADKISSKNLPKDDLFQELADLDTSNLSDLAPAKSDVDNT